VTEFDKAAPSPCKDNRRIKKKSNRRFKIPPVIYIRVKYLSSLKGKSDRLANMLSRGFIINNGDNILMIETVLVKPSPNTNRTMPSLKKNTKKKITREPLDAIRESFLNLPAAISFDPCAILDMYGYID